MARIKVTLNRKQLAARLKDDDIRRAVRAVAEQVKDNVEAQGIKVGDRDDGKHEHDLPVTINSQTTDRAREVVVLPHAAGLAVEAKHGVLVKAASAAGLKVKPKR